MRAIEHNRMNKAIIEAGKTSGLAALEILPEMGELEIQQIYDSYDLSRERFKVVLFNVERGLHINEIEVYMKYHPKLKDADIIFLNELDYGMLRTGNINMVSELSQRLCMNYIFGIEFIELVAGDSRKNIKTTMQCEQNKEAFHGNAIMSRYKIREPFLMRLPVEYDWFYDQQKRLGTRIAIFAKITLGNRELGLVCTHLENRTSPMGRKRQMAAIMEEVEKRFKGISVIVAGDMNTNTYDGTDTLEASRMLEVFKCESDRTQEPEKFEPLLVLAENYGFDYKNANLKGKITRRKPIKGKDTLLMNLDWFFVRGMKCFEPAVISTIFATSEFKDFKGMEDREGKEISDHNAISVKCTF